MKITMRVLLYSSFLMILFMIEGHSCTFIYSMYPDVMEPGSPFYRRNSTYTYADPVNFLNNFFTIYSAPDGFTVAYQLFSEQINGMPAAPNVTILNQTISENHIFKPDTNLYSSTGVHLKGKASLAVMNTNFAIGIVMLWATNDPSSPTELTAQDFYWMGWDSELMENVSSFPQDRAYNQVTSIAISHPDTKAVVAVAVFNSGVFRVILLNATGVADLGRSYYTSIRYTYHTTRTRSIFRRRVPEFVLAYGYQISKFSWAIAVQLIDDNVALNNISTLVFPVSSLPLQPELSYIGNDVVVVTFQLVNATHSSIRQDFINIISGTSVSKQELAAVEDTSITYVYATDVVPNGKLLSTWSISSNNDTFYGLLLDYFNTSNPPVQFSLPAADAAVPIERLIVTPLSTFSFAITQVRIGEAASSFSNYYIVSSCDDVITTPNENCVQGNQGCVNCMCSVKAGYYATLEAIACKTICGDNIVAGNEMCDNTNDVNCVDCTCVQGLVWSTTALLCVTPNNNNDSPTSNATTTPSNDQSTAPAVSGWSNDYIAAIILCPAAAGAAIFLAVYFGKKRKQQAKSNKATTSNPIEMNEGESGTYGSIPTPATELLPSTRTTSSALEAPGSGLKSSQTVDRLNVPYAELKFLTEIGAGAYGKVFIGEWQRVKVALKINTSATGADFEREAKLMVELRPHPNVVQMLLMDFCQAL